MSVLELVVMTLMSGVVELAFMKSPAVSGDIKIYTDTIGLVVTTQLANIKVGDINRFDDMFYQTPVPKRKVGSEEKLTTSSWKI